MKHFFGISILLLSTLKLYGQFPTDVPLELRTQFNGQFDYTVIGNTHNQFDNWQSPTPPCQMLTETSSVLNLNSNQNVVAAYLYWSSIGDGIFDPIIELNGQPLMADEISVVDPEQTNFFLYFGSFKDVTSLVQSEGNGTYTFSDLDLNALLPGYCTSGTYRKGWSILIIYEDVNLQTQQINIYDGLASVFGFGSNNSTTIDIGNLNVIDTQDARLAYLAWNGSPNLFFNESISFNGNVLSDAINPPNNPFNGTNSYTGETDLWNMDLDVFDVSNFLQVGDTQASLTFTSVADRIIQNVVTVIRSELPDAQVNLANFTGISDCDSLDFTIETVVSNPESSDILPANTPISFFVLDSNGDEVFLDTFFTQNDIPINGTETQFLDISIPTSFPENTTLIVKVNTLADGSNPVNENNILNNIFQQNLLLASTPNPILVQNLSQCASLINVTFNLEDAFAEIPNPNETLSFHLNLIDAQNNNNPITNPQSYTPSSGLETIYIRQSISNCFTTTQFDIETLEPPQLNAPTALTVCDTTNDQSGFSTFDLDSKIPEITGGNPDYEVNFFLTQAEAEDLTISNGLSSPFTNTNAFTQVLFVRVTDVNTGCVSFTSLELEVILQAEFIVTEDIPDLLVCDTDDAATFNLTEIEPIAVNDPGDFNITYHTSQSDADNGANPVANPTSFQNTETLQTLWIRVSTLNSLDNCFDTASFQLVVGNLPIPGQPEKLEACDEDFDGIEVFDLSIQNEIIINGLPADENTISYHKTIFDAENDLNALDVNFSNENNPQTIYARLENNSSPQCFTITSFEIEVLESPFIESNEDLIICGDEPLVISIDDSFDSYIWSTGNTTSSNTVTEPGIYEVTGIIEYQDQNCETTATFQVSASGEATITELTVIDWRQDDNAIEIFVQGNGDYEFSIDGLNFQDSNIFEELTEYEYLVTVRDKNGCGETLRRVFLLDYPQFFTPNGDGFNDRWQIINSTREVFSKIYIFDRYGKLIANINPADNGWDGTKNGKPMPSNDYWFRVEREDGRVHTGHFTLKR
jgi:gliding motility-associated-like protein